MRTLNRLFFVSILLAFLVSNGYAADYYLLYDPSCMDRLEYSYEETPNNNVFTAYHLPISATEQIILQAASEKRSREMEISPALLVDCSKGQSLKNPGLVQKINDKVHQIYVALPTNQKDRYRIIPINYANYLKADDRQIVMRTAQFRLTYDLTETSYQGDLSNTDPRGKVFFQNSRSLGTCTAYRFLQKYDYNPDGGLFFEIVPAIGVTMETQSGSTYRLQSVNNRPLDSFLADRCGTTGVADQGAPTDYNSDEFRARGGLPTRTSGYDVATHQVKKGETLYRIAQQYGVEVDDLKRWNNLSGSQIKPDMLLQVSAAGRPLAETRSSPTSYGDMSGFRARGIGPSSPAAGTRKGGSEGPYATNPYEFAWLKSTDNHVVVAGETVATLARLYGYTEERFRYFNQLGENETIQPGDVLLTTDCPVDPDVQFRERGGSPGAYRTQPGTTRYRNQQNDPYYDPDFEFEPYGNIEPRSASTRDGSNRSDMTPRGAVPQSYSTDLRAQQNASSTTSPDDFYGPVPGKYRRNDLPPVSRSADFREKGGATLPTSPQGYSQQPSSRYSDQSDRLYQAPIRTGGNRTTYTVQEGETLSAIARKTGIPEARLRQLNNLEKNEIVLPAQKIYLN